MARDQPHSAVKGWKRFQAAQEWLARNAEKRPTTNVAIDPGIVRQQAAKAAPNDPAAQEKLFQEFMDWAKSQGRR